MTSPPIPAGLPPEEAIKRVLTDQLDQPECWAKALVNLSELDRECQVDALVMLQLAQPIRQFLHQVAGGNSEINQTMRRARMFLYALSLKPGTVTLGMHPDKQGHVLTLKLDLGAVPLLEEFYEEEDKAQALDEYALLTELRMPANALHTTHDKDA
jgi:hypothetical protein